MANRELVNYIKNQIRAGHSETAIRRTLIKTGWDKKGVDDAFNTVKPSVPKPAVPRPRPQRGTLLPELPA